MGGLVICRQSARLELRKSGGLAKSVRKQNNRFCTKQRARLSSESPQPTHLWVGWLFADNLHGSSSANPEDWPRACENKTIDFAQSNAHA